MSTWVAGYQGGSATPSPATTRPYVQHGSGTINYVPNTSKVQAEMSGERISGPPVTAWVDSGNEGGQEGNPAAFEDDVELEKSNILMLGPTGMRACFEVN